ncbi:MAG: tRNA epoxyqueuosine(34) reductase QueG [Prevotella histicola]|nr:tRNA epoxyqueuosine(34) reductase QueG [Prevotella histicola]MBF1399955.1 tRNA epoxyqueuosine(34) reductase QueG [Prevotella histicola]
MIASKIKAEAQRLGFFACGIAKAAPVEENVAEAYRKWLENGEEASMAYMTNYLEKRLNPALLVPGVRSIVSLAMNYAPAQQQPEGEYQLAAYALGQDYHDLMKQRLRELAVNIGAPMELFQKGKKPQSADEKEETGWGIFCDTAPVLERYWAQKAGLGWVGRNHQLIIPHAGSMFFLGEVFLPFAVDVYDTPMQSRCGSCHRCIDACPTHAIIPDEDFHADRCLSYQLIENRGELSDEAKAAMGNTIYGCDRCQTACPWNRFATPNTEPALQPKPELLSMSKEAWHNLSVEDYRRLFKGSAVKRVKFDGLKRNIDATNN